MCSGGCVAGSSSASGISVKQGVAASRSSCGSGSSPTSTRTSSSASAITSLSACMWIACVMPTLTAGTRAASAASPAAKSEMS